MTGIRLTALLTHPVRMAPDRVEVYRVELPPGALAGPHRPLAGSGWLDIRHADG